MYNQAQLAADELRQGLKSALWPGQPDRRPARGEVLDRKVYDDVIVEDLVLTSPQNPADPIPAYLTRPRGASGRLPALICLHGTRRNRDFLVEERYWFERDKAKLHGWARELARRGFATLGITQRCHDGRVVPNIWEWAKKEQLRGRTAMGGLVEDAICAVDYLADQCPDVDPARIGMAGFSLGGIVTFYTTVADPRIRAAAPACGAVGSLEALIDHGKTEFHSTYYYVPGLLRVGDHADLTRAIAPRALLILAADRDDGMPLDGIRDLEAKGRVTYAGLGRADAFAVRIEAGDHNFTPDMLDGMVKWFGTNLG